MRCYIYKNNMTQKKPNHQIFTITLTLLLFFFVEPSLAQQTAIISQSDIFHPVFGEHGMVASQEAQATQIGIDILKRGGNAIDAGVAVGFTLAVTLPRAGNIGGGGFMLIHNSRTEKTVALDYRETAPHKAKKDMFLDEKGKVESKKIRFSHLSVGVPGTVRGLSLALEKFGTLSLQEVLAPAIKLAEEGIIISQDLAMSLKAARNRLVRRPETQKIFLKPNGHPYQPGERLVQKDLAHSLRLIAEQGPNAFYGGEIAEKLVDDMMANGGLITLEDLKTYIPVLRRPVRGTYRSFEIFSMPPPSSGGIHLIQILNLLEPFPIHSIGQNSAETIHLMAEAMKLAYADRAKYLGDPDFWEVPDRGLTSKAYANELRRRMNQQRASSTTAIIPGNPFPYESNETTHFSVMDNDGNVVSNTFTLNFSYGSGIVPAGTGILLNNEMDDFSAKAGVPNVYGLVGEKANEIVPRKRPLSSMTPTIVMKGGKPFLVTGSPGGSRIITTVLQIIMNVIDHKMNIASASVAPRVHHQWLPNELRVEEGLSKDTLALLKTRGHRVVVKNTMGSTQSIMQIDNRFLGFSDPRRPGALALGY